MNTSEATADPSAVGVAVVQMHCRPGDVDANLATIDTMVRQAAGEGAQLVVVPEMATTGYFISDRLDQLAEPRDGPTAKRLSKLAKDLAIHLAVGVVLVEDGAYFDAQLLFGPDGALLATYRKVHLFSAEREWFTAGDEPVVVETPIGRIGMTICYDLIFPEFTRRLVDMGAELIINSTNWITDDFQRDRWGWDGPTIEGLASTRSLENGVWLAMANCVGPEWVFDSIGHSCIVAPSGTRVASAGRAQGMALAQIAYGGEDLDRWKAVATYLEDRRPDIYR